MHDIGWDKRMAKRLTELGVTWEQAGLIVGIICEERMNADLQGYSRGYNRGYADAKKKFDRPKT